MPYQISDTQSLYSVTQSVPPERRGGLRTIAERCERVGGRLTYESSPGAGTWVMVEVAL